MSVNNHLLEEVLSETLEHFVFLFVDPDEEPTVPEGPYAEACISFKGRGLCEELRICTPLALCEEMACNTLGVDRDEIPEGAALDAMQELANMLAGTLSARKFGLDVACQLSTPEAHLVDAKTARALSLKKDAFCVKVEDYVFIATISECPCGKPTGG